MKKKSNRNSSISKNNAKQGKKFIDLDVKKRTTQNRNDEQIFSLSNYIHVI